MCESLIFTQVLFVYQVELEVGPSAVFLYGTLIRENDLLKNNLDLSYLIFVIRKRNSIKQFEKW